MGRGRVGKVLEFIRAVRNGAKLSDVKVNLGARENATAEHFGAPGDDAFPLNTDYVLSVGTNRTGREAVVGYADIINEPKATPGDRRIIGRDADTGVEVVETWLKSDGSALTSNANGSILLKPDGSAVITSPAGVFSVNADGSISGANSAGSFELEAGGNFVVNGVIIDTAGNITAPGVTMTAGLVISGVAGTISGAASVDAATSLTVAGKEIAGHNHPAGSPPGNTGPNN